MPPSPSIGSSRIAPVAGVIAFFDGFEIAEAHLIEARHRLAEAIEIFLVAGGGERRERAPMEGAVEGDDAALLRLAGDGLIFARHLDRAFHRFGAGIREKHGVGEARIGEPLRQPLGFGNAEEVRDVPNLLRLLGERLHQDRMRVAERVHGDAAGKIEVALAVGAEQPSALAPLEGEVGARIGRQQRSDQDRLQMTGKTGNA